MLALLLPALLVTLVLVGIHAYFGLEIIRRGIIFTDLAIGQMAALGTAIALLAFEGQYVYLSSLSLALLSGLLIGLAARREANIEPLIGLLYAFGISAVFLLLSRSPHGMEEIQKLMAYDILFTPLPEIGRTALLYLGLGALLWFSRRWQGLARELAFFLCFAATVTSSVKLAGVLVVFALLVSPALMATYLFRRRRLLWAWLLGSGVNALAIGVSFYGDLPTGYTVVCIQTLAGLLAGALVLCWPRAQQTESLPVLSERQPAASRASGDQSLLQLQR